MCSNTLFLANIACGILVLWYYITLGIMTLGIMTCNLMNYLKTGRMGNYSKQTHRWDLQMMIFTDWKILSWPPILFFLKISKPVNVCEETGLISVNVSSLSASFENLECYIGSPHINAHRSKIRAFIEIWLSDAQFLTQFQLLGFQLRVTGNKMGRAGGGVAK